MALKMLILLLRVRPILSVMKFNLTHLICMNPILIHIYELD